MANYNVDIGVKVRGEELKRFGEQLKLTQKQVNGVNKFLDTFRKENIRVNESITNLNAQLSKAKSTFQNATIGTKQQVQAAKDLIQANQNLNKGLVQQQKLLDDVSGSTAKKAAADNKKLQDGLLKLERQSTREQEQQFLLRQQGQEQLRQKVKEINRERKEENRLIKQNVQQTKKSVAEEIRKKFSIMASHKERRKNFQQSLRELRREQRATAQQIPINDRINEQLKKRGLILSSNGKQIIRNNQNRRFGMGGGLGNAIGSGIIGGGFPLLFGQGATAALGGGIGGAAGGLIGGQFGFALSIAGTTIGNALDQLSKALVKPSENIEMLVNRLGLAGTETGDLALRLEKLGLESDAAELLVREFERTFGLTADEFKENAETLKNFNNEINKLGTSLTLMMANVLNPLIKELNNLIAGKKPEGISRGITGTIDFFTANAFDLDKRGQLLDEIAPILNPTKPPKVSNIPAAEGNPNIPGIGQLNPDFGKPGFVTLPPVKDRLKPFKDKADQKFQREEILPLKQALEIEQKRLTTSSEKLTLMQEQFELTNLENELELLKLDNKGIENGLHDDTIRKLEAQIDLQEAVVANAEALVDPFTQVSNIIAQDIGNGIKGLINGTQTLSGALNSVLNKLKEAALNMALFGNVGGTFEKGSGLIGALFKANGGPVKAGGSYIVGERGPEMFSPGVSGTITPNHALGGSTNNIIVNVDASGSSVQGDEVNSQQLGQTIALVVQETIVREKRSGGLLA